VIIPLNWHRTFLDNAGVVEQELVIVSIHIQV